AVGGITGKPAAQKRQPFRQAAEWLFRNGFLQLGIVAGLDDLDAPVTCQISIIKAEGPVTMGLIFCVPTPITGDEIDSSIAIEVCGGNGIPPAGQLVES